MLLENFMTRFIQEISGKLGKFWKESAEKELVKLLDRVKKAVVDEDGAICWKNTSVYLEDDL